MFQIFGYSTAAIWLEEMAFGTLQAGMHKILKIKIGSDNKKGASNLVKMNTLELAKCQHIM